MVRRARSGYKTPNAPPRNYFQGQLDYVPHQRLCQLKLLMPAENSVIGEWAAGPQQCQPGHLALQATSNGRRGPLWLCCTCPCGPQTSFSYFKTSPRQSQADKQTFPLPTNICQVFSPKSQPKHTPFSSTHPVLFLESEFCFVFSLFLIDCMFHFPNFPSQFASFLLFPTC